MLLGVPLKVGRYRALAELGRGGMANVFLSVIRGPGGVGKLVVVKSLLPELTSDPAILQMFLEEARLSTQLNHTNVVQTYEVGTEGERHVIVMEYLDGQPLSAVLQRCSMQSKPLPLELHLRVLLGVLDGLHYAHELRAYDGAELALVHRDVSPHNVFVCYDGQVKVLDFGIAKANTSSTQTATGLLKGKIAYMAPEQMVGSDIDRRADVYAVGCLLWQMAAGRKLWKDVPNATIFQKVVKGDIPSPRIVNPSCDEELERIVMKALSPSPDARFATALELHDHLERYAARFPRPKARDLGDFVGRLFYEQRAELKARLENQLTNLAEEGQTSLSGLRNPTGLTTAIDLTDGVTPSKSRVERPSRTRRWALAGAALACVGLACAWLVVRPTVSTPVSGGGAPAIPVKSASALITFEATPADAQLVLDGEVLGVGRVEKRLAQNGDTHTLVVTAAGHTKETRAFTVTSDATIAVDLVATEPEPLAAAEQEPKAVKPRVATGKASVKPRAPVQARPSTTSPASAKPDCSQAFFFDLTGMRRVRPECLR